MTTPFTYRQSGTCVVIAWAVDAGCAGLIVGLLNGAEFPRPAPAHHADSGQGPVEVDDYVG